MPTVDPTNTHAAGTLSHLRQRWFAPTRPLPVDDEPRSPFAPGEISALEREGEPPAAATPKP
jgi:hypothetical protein